MLAWWLPGCTSATMNFLKEQPDMVCSIGYKSTCTDERTENK